MTQLPLVVERETEIAYELVARLGKPRALAQLKVQIQKALDGNHYGALVVLSQIQYRIVGTEF